MAASASTHSFDQTLHSCGPGKLAGLLVADKVIVELKVAKEYHPADKAQLLNGFIRVSSVFHPWLK